MRAEGYDPEVGPLVAIPEPFWVRTLRTFFRYRPACYEHQTVFRTRAEWETHYLRAHYLIECPGDGCPGCADCRSASDVPPENPS